MAEPNVLRIIVLDTLDVRLAGNRRPGHWADLSKVTAEVKKTAMIRLVQAHVTDFPRFERPVRITFKVRGLGLDVDNMNPCTKPWIDAMVELGLLHDDKQEWVRSVHCEPDFLPADDEADDEMEIRIEEV